MIWYDMITKAGMSQLSSPFFRSKGGGRMNQGMIILEKQGGPIND